MVDSVHSAIPSERSGFGVEMNSVGTRVISISLTFGSTSRRSSSMNVGDPLALADRGDEVGRIDDVVAGSPDVGQLGLQVLVEHRHAAAVRLHLDAGQEPVVLALADGDEDHVAGDDELRAGDRFRPAATLVIRRAQLVADQLDAGHPPLTVVDDPGRRDHVHDLDAFDARLLPAPARRPGSPGSTAGRS